MPIAVRYTMSEVPPRLINGSGTPVKGKTPVIDAMRIKDCAIISITIPETKSLLKASGELLAIRNPRKAKSK